MPKFKIPQIGALDGIKDKLGFASEDDSRYDDDRTFDDADFEGADGFDDRGYGYGQADQFDDPDFAEIDARGFASSSFGSADDAGYAVPPISAGSAPRVQPVGFERKGYTPGKPNLVTIEDVKAHTATPDGIIRDPMERIRQGRKDTRQGFAKTRESHAAQGGYDDRAETASFEDRDGRTDGFAYAGTHAGDSRFATYSAGSAFPRMRHLEVVRPFSYEEVERVAKALRRGDSVVLDLAATEQGLSKRILDFCFGAASMVDASVECIGRQVFALMCGGEITDAEKDSLRSQGVL